MIGITERLPEEEKARIAYRCGSREKNHWSTTKRAFILAGTSFHPGQFS